MMEYDNELFYEFQNPGENIPSIEIKSGKEAELEINKLSNKISKDNEWNEQVNAINRVFGLINGGALEYDEFVNGIKKLYFGLSAAVVNLRSTLVKSACLLISKLAQELKYSFDQLEITFSPLSVHLSCGTKIIADSCRYAIHEIVMNCATSKILSSILDLFGMRGPKPKLVATEAIAIIIYRWPTEIIGTKWARLLMCLQQSITSSSPECREIARIAAKGMKCISKKRVKEFFSKLDVRIRIAIDQSQTLNITKLTAEECGITSEAKGTNETKKTEVIKNVNNKTQIPIRRTKLKTIDTTKVENLQLIYGHEKQFIQNVRNYIDNGKVKQLYANIESIIIDLMECCLNPNVSVSSLMLINDLIPFYPKTFETHLETLLDVLFLSIEKGTPRVVSNSQIILDELPNVFDNNKLISNIIGINPSNSLISFCLKLINNEKIDLNDESICLNVLHLAFQHYLIGKQKMKKIALEIIEKISDVNKESIFSFSNSLNEDEHKIFSRLIESLNINSDVIISTNINIPQMQLHCIDEWINNIKAMIKEMSETEFKSFRPQLYQEINNKITKTEQIETLLYFIQSLIHKFGANDYNHLLSGLLYHINCDSHRKNIKNIVEMILYSVDTKDLLLNLQTHINNKNVLIAKKRSRLSNRNNIESINKGNRKDNTSDNSANVPFVR